MDLFPQSTTTGYQTNLNCKKFLQLQFCQMRGAVQNNQPFNTKGFHIIVFGVYIDFCTFQILVCVFYYGAVYINQTCKRIEEIDKLYLPKDEEDNSLDAHELCKGLMWFQFLCKNMVKHHQRVQCQGNGNIKNDSEGPVQPTGIHSKCLQCYHQNRKNWADDDELPSPIFEQLQGLVVQSNTVRLQFVKPKLSFIMNRLM